MTEAVLPPPGPWTTIIDHNTGVSMTTSVLDDGTRELHVTRPANTGHGPEIDIKVFECEGIDGSIDPVNSPSVNQYRCGEYLFRVFPGGDAALIHPAMTLWRPRS